MNKKTKEYITIAIGLLVLWGLFGLVSGIGFFGGICKQFDDITSLAYFIIKIAIIIGIIWLIISVFSKDKNNK
ncbi:MAG: hypothetical protein WCK02_14270 [Bacteroidota bacterium]